MTLFADDSTVIIECENMGSYEDEIISALNSIISWMKSNNLQVNLTKTKLMQFRQRIAGYQGFKIDEVDSIKFLGVTVDKSLTWKEHAVTLCSKLTGSSYALFKLSQIVDVSTILKAYHALVASTLRYGVIFWGNCTERETIFKYQKRCIRAMFGLKPIDSCRPFFVKFNILTFPSIYILEAAAFVKQNPGLFEKREATVYHSRLRPRDHTKICHQQSNTPLLTKSVYGMAPVIYNKIPLDIRGCSINQFRKRMNELLTNKCYYTLNEFLSDKL